ncbi:hypothetical protein F53441_8955 [Fusarium austroafricanum]|uniref:Uncharacterized protein n=1 Tax=Fusarium austroafricanum TaxID=2364996 RepID=A0A8H4KCF7_9HYPO|nr:hypothetical protein F53441_8955 [Fusarium austroafricanum]
MTQKPSTTTGAQYTPSQFPGMVLKPVFADQSTSTTGPELVESSLTLVWPSVNTEDAPFSESIPGLPDPIRTVLDPILRSHSTSSTQGMSSTLTTTDTTKPADPICPGVPLTTGQWAGVLIGAVGAVVIGLGAIIILQRRRVPHSVYRH